jgi:hypothetical protein
LPGLAKGPPRQTRNPIDAIQCGRDVREARRLRQAEVPQLVENGVFLQLTFPWFLLCRGACTSAGRVSGPTTASMRHASNLQTAGFHACWASSSSAKTRKPPGQRGNNISDCSKCCSCLSVRAWLFQAGALMPKAHTHTQAGAVMPETRTHTHTHTLTHTHTRTHALTH